MGLKPSLGGWHLHPHSAPCVTEEGCTGPSWDTGALRQDWPRWQEDWTLGDPQVGAAGSYRTPTVTQNLPTIHQVLGSKGLSNSELKKCCLPLLVGAGLNQEMLGSQRNEVTQRGEDGVVSQGAPGPGGLWSVGSGRGPRLKQWRQLSLPS